MHVFTYPLNHWQDLINVIFFLKSKAGFEFRFFLLLD